jgi:hypothetical protein
VESVSSVCRGDSPDPLGKIVQLIPNEMLARTETQRLSADWLVEVANGLLGGEDRDDGGTRCGCSPSPLVVGTAMILVVNNLSTPIISGLGN